MPERHTKITVIRFHRVAKRATYPKVPKLHDIDRNPPPSSRASSLTLQGSRLLICEEIAQASSGRWMSLKFGTLVVSKLSMTFRQTTHFAASPSLLGTSEGVAE